MLHCVPSWELSVTMLSLCTARVSVCRIDFSGVHPLLVDAACELALILSQWVCRGRHQKKQRVGRPSRRDLYVDSVCKHTDEHASVPADFTLDVPVWWVRGMDNMRTEVDVEKGPQRNL